MLLQNLEPEKMKAYCKAFLSQEQVNQKKIEEWFTRALKIKKGSQEAIIAAIQKRVQKMIRDIQFPYLIEAIQNKAFDASLVELGGDEAIKEFMNQFIKTFGSPLGNNPPEEKKQAWLEQVKAQRTLATSSLPDKTVGDLVNEINKAIEISQKLQIDYIDMLTKPEHHRKYIRQRYTQEEYKNQSMNMIELMISKMKQAVEMQLEQFSPSPDVSMGNPKYAKQRKKIEAQKRIVIWQTQQRAKKLRKVCLKYSQEEINRIWGKRKRYWWSR